MTTRLFLLMLPILFAQSPAAQQIYKTRDEQGNVVFTDRPPAPGDEAEQVKLRETNTTPAIEIPPRGEPAPTVVEEPAAPSYSVTITAPANETTIPMGPGNFSVNTQVEPGLRDTETLQLYVDGVAWGEPQAGTSWALTNVFRGAHDLTVAVLDAEGQALASSEAVRVYVLRPSVLRRSGN